jgi:predicted Fe-S protein YdhL (DUF1289 family)
MWVLATLAAGIRTLRLRPTGNSSMASQIENPCISLCQLKGDLCVSCGRSKDEIRKWKRMKRPEKMAAVQKAAARLKGLKK